MKTYFNLEKKYSVKYFIIATIIISISVCFIVNNFYKHKQQEENLISASSFKCNYDIKRLEGYKFIKPLMFVDDECESENLNDLKQQVTSIVDKYKISGDLNNASVYVREFKFNSWTTINDGVKYEPGSIFKVPVMIAILKMNEFNPGFLNKTIIYSKNINDGKNVAFNDKSIILGNTYTIRELLTYMIKYSDNKATILLENKMDSRILQKLFKDVGLEVPNIYASQYQFTPKEYSYFMRAIYNAAYLTSDSSEFAAELLSQTNFKDGILKGLPSNTNVAHKFGESGNQIEKQLHESALVYLNNKTYLLTIMTRGKENSKLSQVLAEISQTVYNYMKNDEVSMM